MIKTSIDEGNADSNRATFRVASFPAGSANPYLDLFYEALGPYGVERVGGFRLSPRWLLANRRELEAIHLHWPEWLWDGRFENGFRALLKMEVVFQLARTLGIRLVWTVHNLDPHEGEGLKDRWGQRLLARHCDLLIVHSQLTEEQVKRKLSPKAPVVVMPHGSYDGHYPPPRPRAVVMEAFGLEHGRPVLCCVGRLREYKGLDIACEALARLDDDVQLVIAGIPHPGFDMSSLERSAERRPNLTLVPRMLDDQEFVDLLSVAEAVLLPYRQITGSGVLLAAWSQGCGVIASDLDFFREMLPAESHAGRLFSAGDAEALATSIRTYLAVPKLKRKKAAHEMAEHYTWDRCVEPVGLQFRSWQGNTSGTVRAKG